MCSPIWQNCRRRTPKGTKMSRRRPNEEDEKGLKFSLFFLILCLMLFSVLRMMMWEEENWKFLWAQQLFRLSTMVCKRGNLNFIMAGSSALFCSHSTSLHPFVSSSAIFSHHSSTSRKGSRNFFSLYLHFDSAFRECWLGWWSGFDGGKEKEVLVAVQTCDL